MSLMARSFWDSSMALPRKPGALSGQPMSHRHRGLSGELNDLLDYLDDVRTGLG
jgi:hypothetical protein